MSNYDLLNPEETKIAAAQGWSLNHVYDMAPDKWRVMVLASPSADAGARFVIEQARAGSALAQKALSLVMKSNQGK